MATAQVLNQFQVSEPAHIPPGMSSIPPAETSNLTIGFGAESAATATKKIALSSPAIVMPHAALFAATISGARSQTYLASQRRRRGRIIRESIEQLSQHIQKSDFHSFVFPIVDDIRKAISFFDDSEQFEGNSCAILRQIRNTLMDGGWENYRRDEVRSLALKVLLRLDVDQVEGDAVRDSFKDLFVQKCPLPLQ